MDVDDSAGWEKVYDNTVTFASGETKSAGVGGSPGDVLRVFPAPENDSGNIHTYEEQLFWSDGGGGLRWRVTETADAGGGDCRIVVYKLD